MESSQHIQDSQNWDNDFKIFIDKIHSLDTQENQKNYDFEKESELLNMSLFLKSKYPNKAESYFYLARYYRCCKKYNEALIELSLITQKNQLWDSPDWLIKGEVLFENSIIQYYIEPTTDNALCSTVEYLNNPIEISPNYEYALDNLLYFCRSLSKLQTSTMSKMNLPNLGSYHPSSVNYLNFQGKDLFCIRYVNYNILENGDYDEQELNTCNMIMYENKCNIIENNICLSNFFTNYRGIEDVRLYCLPNDNSIYFSGTQQEWVETPGVNKIILGTLNLNKITFTDASVIHSPFENLCEKNWIPWINSKGELYFFYWWYPFQIGKKVGNQLNIVYEQKNIPHIFEFFRGSSNVVYIEDTREYLCVVHFVHSPTNGKGTRRYYHSCVFLQEDSTSGFANIIGYTLPFTFCDFKEGKMIEYCIGLRLKNKDITFWFSRMDAEPHELRIPLYEIIKMRRNV